MDTHYNNGPFMSSLFEKINIEYKRQVCFKMSHTTCYEIKYFIFRCISKCESIYCIFVLWGGKEFGEFFWTLTLYGQSNLP